MNWIDQLNQSIEYIESNLAEGKIFNCNLSNLEIYDCCLDGMKVNRIDIKSLLSAATLQNT